MRSERHAPNRRPTAAGLVLLMALSMVLPASSVRAAEPNETAGARHLADALGGSPNDFDLLHERMLEPQAGSALWSAKYMDSRTGEVHVVYRDPSDGAVAGQELATAHIAEATAQLTALEVKGDDELLDAVGPRAMTPP